MKIKKIFSNPIIFIILIIGFLIGVNIWQKQIKNKIFITGAEITIKSTDLKVKIAETPEEAYQGLSGQEKIPSRTGMLFLYDHDSLCYHVMREMLFDLDFVFLKDGKVVSIEENIPKDFKGVIQAESACNQVLEINAGEVEDLKIEVGDEMKIK